MQQAGIGWDWLTWAVPTKLQSINDIGIGYGWEGPGKLMEGATVLVNPAFSASSPLHATATPHRKLRL